MAGQPSLLWHCLWGRGQRGNNVARLLSCSTTFQRSLSCKTGIFSHCGNPAVVYSKLESLVSCSASPALPAQSTALPWVLWASPAACLRTSYRSGECIFNSLVDGVPCSLIFWHFLLLFLDWLLSSFWLSEEGMGFYLCLHLGWNSEMIFLILSNILCSEIYSVSY